MKKNNNSIFLGNRFSSEICLQSFTFLQFLDNLFFFQFFLFLLQSFQLFHVNFFILNFIHNFSVTPKLIKQ